MQPTIAAMDQVDALVVGAGVVGLACARELALAGLEVLILESEAAIGSGVSSRSSEVIHAGLYDPPTSWKARLCVAGRALLYDYCAARGVGHRRCGKLVVAATAADLPKLDSIAERARANGVHDLQRLSGAEAHALEPALGPCAAALLSPSSGIVDSHGLMTALLGDAENAGASLVLRTPFVSARREAGLWRVTSGGDAPFELGARCLVNAAGLSAQAVAAAIEGVPRDTIPRAFRAKGNYFALAAKAPFSHLIYPTPVDGGLGVHLTLDLGGQARFGPDVQWLADGEALDYAVDPGRRAAFAEAIRRYWPGLPEASLQPAYAGVRPKLAGPGAGASDFVIQGPSKHGADGLVQLFGIESPGITAALAIAREVHARLMPGAAADPVTALRG